MVHLSMLWLPIIVSAVIVFVASTILWMSPFWHGRDYARSSESAKVVAAFSSVKSGQYMFPCLDWGKATAEEKAEAQRGPMALVVVRNPGTSFSFPVALISYFIYCVVVSVLVAYVAGITLQVGTHYLTVFRVVSTTGILAYSFGTVGESVWYGKPWPVTIRVIIDGVIYGLLMAGTFGWLWPR